MEKDCKIIWTKCLRLIEEQLPPKTFKTWFEPIRALKLKNDVLTIQVASSYVYECLEERFIDILRSSLKTVIGPNAKLEYSVVVENQPKKPLSVTLSSSPEKRPETNTIYLNKQLSGGLKNPFERTVNRLQIDSQLNPVYTMESFIEGSCNRLAKSAGMAIAKNPGGTAFNPLLIYGGSGLGKTHLAQAIGLEVKQNFPEKVVLYVSTNLFQTQFTEAVRKNEINDFMHFYQLIDVLILDDIHELAGKTATQNTFFHIFNHLQQLGKQLILTSDKAPAELSGIEDRLLSRFKWGLTAKVERPDYELRRNILMNKVVHDGLAIPEPVIDYIARNVTDNVRDLEGIIVSLMAHATIFNREVDIDLADRVLSNSVKIEKKQITAESIKDTVCGYFNIEPRLLQAKSRKSEIVQARHISMFLAKKYTELSLACIGDVIGKRDHATVLHACKTIGERMAVDKSLKAALGEIEELLQK